MNDQLCHIFGFPDDSAVVDNNGRPGASGGPRAFRQYFSKLKGPIPVLARTIDHGDIAIEKGQTAANHERAIAAMAEHAKDGGFTVLVGGGHDYAYCQLAVLAAWRQDQRIGCINIDTHFDLRSFEPKILSGSPFALAIARKAIRGEDLIAFGAQLHCNGPELWEAAELHGVEVHTMPELLNSQVVQIFAASLSRLANRCDAIALSLDLDALQAAFAPGVSAPAAEGFNPAEVFAMIRLAGAHPKVLSLGIYELNPHYDHDDATARLAAALAFHFALARMKS